MPYKDPKQAKAIFLSIEREKGLAAAKMFGAKHREDFKGRKPKSYRGRGRRSK